MMLQIHRSDTLALLQLLTDLPPLKQGDLYLKPEMFYWLFTPIVHLWLSRGYAYAVYT